MEIEEIHPTSTEMQELLRDCLESPCYDLHSQEYAMRSLTSTTLELTFFINNFSDIGDSFELEGTVENTRVVSSRSSFKAVIVRQHIIEYWGKDKFKTDNLEMRHNVVLPSNITFMSQFILLNLEQVAIATTAHALYFIILTNEQIAAVELRPRSIIHSLWTYVTKPWATPITANKVLFAKQGNDFVAMLLTENTVEYYDIFYENRNNINYVRSAVVPMERNIKNGVLVNNSTTLIVYTETLNSFILWSVSRQGCTFLFEKEGDEIGIESFDGIIYILIRSKNDRHCLFSLQNEQLERLEELEPIGFKYTASASLLSGASLVLCTPTAVYSLDYNHLSDDDVNQRLENILKECEGGENNNVHVQLEKMRRVCRQHPHLLQTISFYALKVLSHIPNKDAFEEADNLLKNPHEGTLNEYLRRLIEDKYYEEYLKGILTALEDKECTYIKSILISSMQTCAMKLSYEVPFKEIHLEIIKQLLTIHCEGTSENVINKLIIHDEQIFLLELLSPNLENMGYEEKRGKFIILLPSLSLPQIIAYLNNYELVCIEKLRELVEIMLEETIESIKYSIHVNEIEQMRDLSILLAFNTPEQQKLAMKYLSENYPEIAALFALRIKNRRNHNEKILEIVQRNINNPENAYLLLECVQEYGVKHSEIVAAKICYALKREYVDGVQLIKLVLEGSVKKMPIALWMEFKRSVEEENIEEEIIKPQWSSIEKKMSFY